MPTEYNHLKGHICLVTGSSRGIGAQIARTVAAAGARTVINYHSSQEQAIQLLEELTEQGYQVMAVRADISQGREVEAMFAQIEDKWGSVDLLVNNAGISLKRLLFD